MKIAAGRVESFLKRPDPAVRAVLVYGPDIGLVGERALALIGTVVDDPADPFRVSFLTGSGLAGDPALLGAEAGAMSLTGGRRVVRLREATDRNADSIKAILQDPLVDALIVAEAGELAAGSRLRKLFEQSDGAAAIACYGDEGVALERLIEETLSAFQVTASPDAIAYLAGNLGADRQLTRREIEKLALYAGSGGHVGLEDAEAIVGDSATVTLDDVVNAAAGGNYAALETSLKRVWNEGLAPVAVLRAATRHFERLFAVTSRTDIGQDPTAAMKSLRPPVFWKREQEFRRQLTLWPMDALASALDRLLQAEIRCKQSGYPDQEICHRTLLELGGVARRAASPR